MTYRISLRSSSLWEPRHPLLKVFNFITSKRTKKVTLLKSVKCPTCGLILGQLNDLKIMVRWTNQHNIPKDTVKVRGSGNDPSAGSPTETLLRLHLPLNDEV